MYFSIFVLFYYFPPVFLDILSWIYHTSDASDDDEPFPTLAPPASRNRSDRSHSPRQHVRFLQPTGTFSATDSVSGTSFTASVPLSVPLDPSDAYDDIYYDLALADDYDFVYSTEYDDVFYYHSREYNAEYYDDDAYSGDDDYDDSNRDCSSAAMPCDHYVNRYGQPNDLERKVADSQYVQ